jgi:hypothetical protein
LTVASPTAAQSKTFTTADFTKIKKARTIDSLIINLQRGSVAISITPTDFAAAWDVF